MNLFTINLAQDLTFDLVEQFLRVNDPEGDRPQESTILDFNENVPQDLGDVVTAFSNTDGGLVILGVREKKNGQLAIPEAITGIPSPQAAVQGKIVNIIWSTVQPRPIFSLGIVALRNAPEKVLAVLRVEEGVDPPYMFIGNQRNKISMRVGDSNRAATLEQLRALFEKAKRSPASVDEALSAIGDLYVLRGESRCPTFQQWAWIPSRPLRIRMDQQRELELEETIRRCFHRDGSSQMEITRNAEVTDFDGYNREWKYHRKWRFTDKGGVGFVTKIGRAASQERATQTKEEMDRVGDWVLDSLCFIRLAQEISENLGYSGSGRLIHRFSCHMAGQTITIAAEILLPNLRTYGEMRGIGLPNPITVPPLPSEKDWRISMMQLNRDDIVELLAESFLYHVRHMGGHVDWEALNQEVKLLMDALWPSS